jgi:CheY-like chemotaxis protein
MPCYPGDAMAHVLVVEDDEGIRESIRDLLQEEGYQVVTASHGEEALARMREGIPAVVLLDLMMPVMNGWQFLERVAKDASLAEVPIVVISAAGESGALPHRVAGFIKKPIGLQALLDVVKLNCESSAPR